MNSHLPRGVGRVPCKLAILAAVLTISACASTHALSDFATDGCSLFPDGDAAVPTRWCDCCVSHDIAYWRGGTADERKSADEALRGCVLARTGRPALANAMVRGVRIGGMPMFPSSFRWGYGWNYGRGYQPLLPEEQQQADEKIAAYRRVNPETFCARERAGGQGD